MAKITSGGNLARALTIILGVVTIGVGYYAFFTSTWVELEISVYGEVVRLYDICEVINKIPGSPACPDFVMEQIFIAVVTISAGASLIGLLIAFVIKSRCLDILHAIGHIASAVALVVAGILFIVSAQQIYNLGFRDEFFQLPTSSDDMSRYFGKNLLDSRQIDLPDAIHFRRIEKIVAGVLAIVNGVLYLITALLIMRQGGSSHTV